MIEIVLVVVVGILWTFLVLIGGYKAGLDQGREDTEIMGGVGPQGPVGPMGVPGKDADMSRVGACEETIRQLANRIGKLEERQEDLDESTLAGGLTARMSAAESRLTRVERKAGMSV